MEQKIYRFSVYKGLTVFKLVTPKCVLLQTVKANYGISSGSTLFAKQKRSSEK